MSDLVGTLLTIGVVLLFLILSEVLAHFDKITSENARKLIHISVGNIIFFLPLFTNKLIAASIPAAFTLGNYFLSPKSPIEKLRIRTFEAGHTWGTILYPLGLTIVTYFGFDTPWIIVASFLPVVWGDGFAAVFGPKAEKNIYQLYNGTKTALGTSSMGFFTWLSVFVGILIFGYTVSFAGSVASIVTILTILIELFSPKGTDNLVLSLFLLPLNFIFEPLYIVMASQLVSTTYLIAIGVGAIIAIIGYKLDALNLSGAFTGFLITTYMFGLGGYTIGLELLLFFILGSIATIIVGKAAGATQDTFEKGGSKRDAQQALANAGIPAVLSIPHLLSSSNIWFYFISGIMIASLIDTMATEIGIAFQGKTYQLFSKNGSSRIGTTGAISIEGSFGGVIFGTLFAFITYGITFLDPYIITPRWYFVPIVIVGGVIGMFADSLIGQSLQRNLKCKVCELLVESKIHHNKVTEHIGGLSWFNNDLTNLTGSFIGGLSTLILFLALIN